MCPSFLYFLIFNFVILVSSFDISNDIVSLSSYGNEYLNPEDLLRGYLVKGPDGKEIDPQWSFTFYSDDDKKDCIPKLRILFQPRAHDGWQREIEFSNETNLMEYFDHETISKTAPLTR